MLFSLTLHSIYPTTIANTGVRAMAVDFTLSGDGISLPGIKLSIYNTLTGGTEVKTLYVDYQTVDFQSGHSLQVSLEGVDPGVYFVEFFYKTTGTPRKPLTVTGQSSGGSDVRNLKLNGTVIAINKLNGSNVSKETLNGNKVYE